MATEIRFGFETSTSVTLTGLLRMSPKVESLEKSAITWTFICTGVFGILSNLFIILVVLRSKELKRQPRNWLLFHQCTADFLTACFLIANVTKPTAIKLQGFEGLLLCVLWMGNFLFKLSSTASTYILSAFVVEIYLAIVHPIRHKNVISHRLINGVVVIIWILSVVYYTALFFDMSRVINYQCYSLYAWPVIGKYWGTMSVLLKICIPFAIFIFCYLKIIHSLRIKINPLQRDVKDAQPTVNNHYMKCRKNVAMTLFYSTVMLTVSWTGNQVQLLAYAYGYPLDTTSYLYQFLLLLVYLNGCINPFIYVIKYKQFRIAVAKQFYRRCSAPRNNSTTNILSLHEK